MENKTPFSHTQRLWVFVLVVGLLLVCLPRFNRQDLGLALTPGGRPANEVMGDAVQYMGLIQHFRGQTPDQPLRAPFAHRPLAPFLASFLPFDPLTALNLINLAALLLAMFFIYRALAVLGMSTNRRLLGCGLFVFAFPTFYYGTIGFVDPVLIGFLSAATFFLLSEQWVLLLISLGLGALARETMLLFLLVLITHFIFCKGAGWRGWRQALYLFLALAIMLLALYLARALSPVQGAAVPWYPSLERFLRNAGRVRSWLGLILTLGVPGWIAMAALLRRWRRLPRPYYALAAGFLTFLAVFPAVMFVAYADGRFVWPSVIFAIPIAVWAIPGTHN
jgi:hypothetical protein